MTRGSGKGWIGLDLGHRRIVIAQLRRSGASLRISAAYEMPRTGLALPGMPNLGGYSDVSRHELETARLLASGLTGRAAACALPLSVSELTHVSLPPGQPREQYAMVANELEDTSSHSHRQFDFWPSAVSGGEPSTGLLDVNVISIEEPRASAVADTLHAARFDCRVLDSLPHAVARAVSMAVRGYLGRPLAALHLGYDIALFVLSRDGVPVFVRQFRDAGMHRIVSRIGESLGLLEEEAVHVLRELGLPDVTARLGHNEEIQDVVAEIVEEPLAGIADELRRTLSYLSAVAVDTTPDGVCLLGDGAAIRNLGRYLAVKADISVWNWDLADAGTSHGPSGLSPPLLAVASALSDLAWES